MLSLHIDIFQFQKSIELFSYYNYENHRDFVQFATELQKFANKTLYASSQISTKIFLEAKCPVYSSAHSGILGSYKCNLVVRFPMSDTQTH